MIVKETIDYFRQSAIEAKDVARLQIKPFLASVAILFGLYLASLFIPPGWATYAAIVPAALVCALTALARTNDIGVECLGTRWHVRRVGLILAGAGAVMLLATPFTSMTFPTWRAVIFVWGIALTWITTPNMPPWHDYITGRYREHPKPRSPLDRIAARVDRRPARRGDGDGP
jgi:hypothetical protein